MALTLTKYYPSGAPREEIRAWKRKKTANQWSAKKVALAHPEGYLREMNWHSAIALDMGLPNQRNSDVNTPRLRAVISVSAWREQSLKHRPNGKMAWRHALVQATQILCKHAKTRVERQRLGHLRVYWQALATATHLDHSWLNDTMNTPLAWTLVEPSWMMPSNHRLGLVKYTGNFSQDMSTHELDSALHEAKTTLEKLFGHSVVASIESGSSEAWVPTQDEWFTHVGSTT